MKLVHFSRTFYPISVALLLVTSLAIDSCSNSPSNTPNAAAEASNAGESPPYVAPKEPFPLFGTSANYATLSNKNLSFVGTNTVYGYVGLSTEGAIVGLSTLKMTGGEIHQDDSASLQAQKDSTTAYTNLKNNTCDHDFSGKDLGGLTLLPGTYCFSGGATLTGTLILDAQGNPFADFVFQIGDTLDAAAGSVITMINSGETCNVFWQVAHNALLETNVTFGGSILSEGDITLDSTVRLNGKVVSNGGMITINSSEIYNNTCPWQGA